MPLSYRRVIQDVEEVEARESFVRTSKGSRQKDTAQWIIGKSQPNIPLPCTDLKDEKLNSI